MVRKDKQQRKYDPAEQDKTKGAEQTVQNTAESEFVRMLEQIDFSHSRLDKEFLNHKSDQRQLYGDLEHTKAWLVQQIGKQKTTEHVDTSEIDIRLKQLIQNFEESIRNGNEQEALHSREGLKRCFKEIRFSLPGVLPQGSDSAVIRDYLEQCRQYLDLWLYVIYEAKVEDIEYRNYKNQEKNAERRKQEHEEELDAFKNTILEDYPEEYRRLEQGNPAVTPKEKDLHNKMVELGTQKTIYYSAEAAKDSAQQRYIQAKAKREEVYNLTCNVPIARDPNAMEKFRKAMDQTFRKYAETDQEFIEFCGSMEEIRGRLEAMSALPGQRAMAAYAARASRAAEEEVKASQQSELLTAHQNVKLENTET